MISIKLKKVYSKGNQDECHKNFLNAKEDMYSFYGKDGELFLQIQGALNEKTLNHNEPSNPVSKEEIETWLDNNEANAIARINRLDEYPTYAEQLDDIYHNGIDGWKATIKAVKDKYPKEE